MAAETSSTTTYENLTPQKEYTKAINFNDEPLDAATNQIYTSIENGQKQNKFKLMLSNIMKNTTNSQYVYPTISIIVVSLFVIIMLFQTISLGVKILAVILMLLFIAFTVYRFKRH
ncbi:putative gp51-like protein [Esparto virus]|uniref:Putative gp51-like protein n=1 Tax=Esparto virus TaxID=2072209 RepID=A0A2I7G310_9VIRU|nr:putative gp51-like protein [Esparto virus]AUQ44019.1 putative gp51-like protein [Esparto virus]